MFSLRSKRSRRHLVAFVEPDQTPSVRTLRQAFFNDFSEAFPIHHGFRIFDGRSDQSRMAWCARRGLSRPYNIVIGVGLSVNSYLKDALRWRMRKVPIIFADVENPIEMGLIQPESKTGKHFTGINVENKDFSTHVARLKKLAPSLSRALVICNTNQAHDNMPYKQYLLFEALRQNSISPYLLDHDNPHTLAHKLFELAQSLRPDIIVTMKDDATQCAWESVLDVCNDMRIPVFASELDSVTRGFTFGCGISYELMGKECARRAIEIVEKGATPSELPLLTFKQTNEVWVNGGSLYRHNLELDDEARNWVRAHGKFV